MRIGRRQATEADTARDRLLLDQLQRPLVEQRIRLRLVVADFERASRDVLITMVAARLRQDARYAPVLQKLIRLTPPP